MFGPDAIGELALGAIDTGALPSGQGLADRLARGEAPGLVNFIEITGRALTGGREPDVEPIGGLPLAALPDDILLVGDQRTLLLSDREWCGRPDDPLRPNQLSRPVLSAAGDYTTRAPVYPEETRRAQQTVAAVRVIDDEGFLTAFLRDNAIAGGRVAAFFGEEDGYASDHVTYFDAIVKDTERDGRDVIINLDTAQTLLDSPAQGAVYSGAGGEGGDAYLKDQYLPLVFGEFFNAAPVREDFANLSYRMSVGEIDGYDAIKDRGVPLNFDGRHFTTYADYILASAPAPGFYSTGPSSRFRLGAEPVGVVTCDGRGSILFGVYSATTRAILRYVLGSGRSLGFLFNEATFGFLPDDEIGLYLDGATAFTKEEIANALLAPYLAWIDTDPAGLVGIARAGDPDAGSPVDTLIEDDILEGWRATPLSNPVRLSQEVTWGRNWRPMEPDEIADPAEQPLVSVELFNRLQREEEIAEDGDESLLGPYPSAKAGPQLRGYFANSISGEQAAKDSASEIFAFFGRALDRVAVPVQTYRAVNMQRGRRIAIIHSEITGGASKNMTIFEINPSPTRGVTEIVGVMSA